MRNWCNLVGICPMWNAKSGWKFVTFDLDIWPWELFSYFFLIWAILFEWLYLATSFSVWKYIFGISGSNFSFKVMGLSSRSRQQKFENYWSEIAAAWLEYRSNSELLTFASIMVNKAVYIFDLALETYFHIFWVQLGFKSLKLAALFSVWRYIL